MRLFMSQSPTISHDSQETPEWWATVQQDRDELPAEAQLDSWLNEEIDFTPRRARFERTPVVEERRQTRRFVRTDAENRVLDALGDFGDDVGEMVTAPPKRGRTGSFDVVLDDDGTLVATETLTPSTLSTDELVLTVPPVLDRPTVRITGHPEQVAASRALRHRDRTLMEMIGPHPDRIAFWVVLLGITLIVLSQLSS